jgi:hypothetical protein
MFHQPIAWLTRFPLFRRAQSPQGAWDIIAWWELRRIPYNLIVGAAGFGSTVLIVGTALITEQVTGEPVGLPDPPIFAVLAVVAYAILANVCYTGGWAAELLSRRVWGDRAQAFGEIAFTLGTVASVFLTLIPGVLVALLGIYVVMSHS